MTTKNFLGSKKIATQKVAVLVGQANNPFGTRLCTRIVCSRCQKTDYISLRVSAKKSSLCRECAEQLLQRFELGRRIVKKQVKRFCHQCQKTFLVNEDVSQKKDELFCADCYRGFDLWRGKIGLVNERILNKSFETNGKNTVIRKKTP